MTNANSRCYCFWVINHFSSGERCSTGCLIATHNRCIATYCGNSVGFFGVFASTIVCTLTGNGLKDPDTAIQQCTETHPVSVDASLDAVKKAILDNM
jgi:hypothetical protein